MSTEPRPRVAAIVTAYYPRSHADVIVSKLLADLTHPAPRDLARFDFHRGAREFTELPLPTDTQGQLKPPRLQVVSIYTDQVPDNDISREWAERAGVPIFATVREALTLGGESLAVDGVLIIGEHGEYPHNERGQHLYPRRRLFEEAVAVIREAGRAIPVFVDKHLSYAWDHARWMYDTARELGIPLVAGSSISTTPVGWRTPPVEVPLGAPLTQAMAVGFGPIEAYGFHTLEVLQCQVERRSGGETGVAAVQTLSGQAVWEAARDGRWDRSLLDAALATLDPAPTDTPEAAVSAPAIFLIEYRDGLQVSVCMLDGLVRQWLFAARVSSPAIGPAGLSGTSGITDTSGALNPSSPAIALAQEGHLLATRFGSYTQEPFGHFAWLLEDIQALITTSREPHPVERTLLTTGILDRAMESRWRNGARLETPELAISYQVEHARNRNDRGRAHEDAPHKV